MAWTEVQEPASFRLVTRRNQSLSLAGRQFVLASLFVVSLAISLAFATIGAWPVLPFAGLELAGLYWAFRVFEQGELDFETIGIQGDRLVIEVREQGKTQRFECNLYWAQVQLMPAQLGIRATLQVRSQGREVVFGRHLPEDKLMELASRIKQQIRNQ